jgi:hypothetical protein
VAAPHGGPRGLSSGRGGGDRNNIPPSYVNSSTNSILHYPPQIAIRDEDLQPIGSGKEWVLPDQVKARIQSQAKTPDIVNPQHPLRSTFSNLAPPTHILTNHFDYKISAKQLWEYKITGFNETKKDKIKYVFLKAIEQ